MEVLSEVDYYPWEPAYIRIHFRLDSFQDVYSREIYNTLTFLGDIGGLNDALVFICTMLVGTIQSKLLYAAIIKRLF